ncbi:MAG: ABC-2 family transporter protein [Patescibacteria group bacterium]|nr:ABC-2 family transporter protein [Patescibacteria group bacterium]
MKKYLKIWYLNTANAVMADVSKRVSAVFLLLGKSVRIVLFGSFLFILLSGKKQIAGYSLTQAMVFYLTFNLIDTLSQLLLRGTYYFRALVLKGDLDYILAHPINPLFSVLFAHTDFLDFIMFWPILAALVYSLTLLPAISLSGVFLFLILIVNGLMLAAGFHIFVLALAITTYEVDNALMIYRDLSSLGRVPVDLYREPVRFLITFVLPVGIMVTFPVKALIGLLNPSVIVVSVAVSVLFFGLSLYVWNRALSLYSSASS